MFVDFRHFDKMDETNLDATNWLAITLFGICLLNMAVRFVSCQPINQIRQICLRTLDFYRIGTRKSIGQDKNENIQGQCIPSACESVYSEIFVPHHVTARFP